MKSFEEHYQDYVEAEAYDYPRGQVTVEGFARYLARVAMPTPEEQKVEELTANFLARETSGRFRPGCTHDGRVGDENIFNGPV